MAADPFDLGRFVVAQEGVYETALSEIRRGDKRTHWMWFIFPQMKGLGRSATASHFGIGSAEEARAYLAHPLSGYRLKECTTALQQLQDAAEVFGEIDGLKLRSSLTLFTAVRGGTVFEDALARWFGGADQQTMHLLR